MLFQQSCFWWLSFLCVVSPKSPSAVCFHIVPVQFLFPLACLHPRFPPCNPLTLPLATERRRRRRKEKGRRRRRRMRRMRRKRKRQMMKVIQSLRPLDRALAGILGQLWFPKRDTVSPQFFFHLQVWLFSSFPLDSLVFCHPSVAPAVIDTPEMCLNLNCMANLLPKASDPEGQRKCLIVKTRTSSPVSIAPKKRTLSPWCVPPQLPDCVPGFACPRCQSTPISPTMSPSEKFTTSYSSCGCSTPGPLHLTIWKRTVLPCLCLFVAHSLKTESKT